MTPTNFNTPPTIAWTMNATATPWADLERLLGQMRTGQVAIHSGQATTLRQRLEHYILVDHAPVPAVSVVDWAHWLEENHAERVVQQTILANGYFVSTVFLGRDLNESDPPCLFETMVFTRHESGDDVFTQRTATWDAAWDAHLAAVFQYQKEAPYVPPDDE
jgi:hypothetical protein